MPDNTGDAKECSVAAIAKPDFFAPLKLLQRFLAGCRYQLTMAIGLATLAVAFEIVPIWVVYRVIVAVIEQSADFDFFLLQAGIALIAILASTLFLGLALGLSHIVAFNILYDIRLSLARHMSSLPLGFLKQQRSGDVKKALIDDSEQLELIVAHGFT